MTNNSRPSVSVVIPVKDRREALLRAVKSVMEQTHPVQEIIVVDDGSQQRMKDEVKALYPSVIYLRNEVSMGAPRARNDGWKTASSELIAFLDSDDEFEPDCLSDKISLLITNNLDMVVGSVKLDDGKTRRSIPYKINNSIPLRDNLLGNNLFDARTSTILIRKTVLGEISFDEKLRKHQDWDLFINVDSRFKTGFTNNCDVIIHIAEQDRISNTLKHDATIRFVQKNKSLVNPDALFLFMVKMLFRAQRLRDEEGEAAYIKIIREEFGKLSLRNRFLRALLIRNIISAKLLHALKQMLKR